MAIKTILETNVVNNDVHGKGFKVLNATDFNGNKVQFSLYRDSLENYHKMLYISRRNPAKDKALLKVLEVLDFKEEEKAVLKKADIHNNLVLLCTKKSKVKTDFGKELLNELKEEKEKLLLADTKVSASAREAGLKDIRDRRNTVLYATEGVWEPVKLAKVSEASFREAFEIVLGRTILSLELKIDFGETRVGKRLNNKWRKLQEKATLANVASDTFEKYHEKNDADGLRKAIEASKKKK